VRMDSLLVVEQMRGRWRIKHPGIRPLALRARRTVSPTRSRIAPSTRRGQRPFEPGWKGRSPCDERRSGPAHRLRLAQPPRRG
jgi:hypothetical protein